MYKIPAEVPCQNPEFTPGRGALTNCPLELRTFHFQLVEFVQALVIPLWELRAWIFDQEQAVLVLFCPHSSPESGHVRVFGKAV